MTSQQHFLEHFWLVVPTLAVVMLTNVSAIAYNEKPFENSLEMSLVILGVI